MQTHRRIVLQNQTSKQIYNLKIVLRGVAVPVVGTPRTHTQNTIHIPVKVSPECVSF